MRPVNEITATEENFHTEPFFKTGTIEGRIVKRDPVKPEPEGTIILVPFRIAGYDADCDGSLMARLKAIDKDGFTTGWETNCHGLSPDKDLVVTPKELKALFEGIATSKIAAAHS